MMFPVLVARRVLASIAILSVMLTPAAALAKRAAPGEEAEIARCIRIASRGHTWLEKTLWGLREQEAGWLGAEVANSNGTHDLGPLQINSWWVPRIARLVGRPERQVRHWLQHDACFNAEAARWIFISGFQATGNYWQAVGIYHSPTVWRQHAYAGKVAMLMRARFGADVFAAATAEK
ncbi:MAG: murein transglycosylase [Sphingobium sp. 32-64-5]|nr:MAG: murein transglycosylase [Sphingobium sp. 32-64-5]